jgi:hypothetical protein
MIKFDLNDLTVIAFAEIETGTYVNQDSSAKALV